MSAVADFAAFKSKRFADQLIGRSSAMRSVREAVSCVAPSDASVIITGPSGSGKELVAQAIHSMSPRSSAPIIAVNCGAIPTELLESELFGHEKGAFTGATCRRVGRFEEAQGGTIFLDEIGDMPLNMQVKLLRVLETRKLQRVGGTGEIDLDVRVICATHRDIDIAIDAGTFREDLYYRLAVFPIMLPALSERKEDVALLIEHFQAKVPANARFGLSASAMSYAESYSWPGNIRELRNFVERANLLFPGKVVGPGEVADILALTPRRRAAPSMLASLETHSEPEVRESTKSETSSSAIPALGRGGSLDVNQVLEDIERRYILDALQLADGVIAEASRLLGMQRTTLIGKINKYKLARAG